VVDIPDTDPEWLKRRNRKAQKLLDAALPLFDIQEKAWDLMVDTSIDHFDTLRTGYGNRWSAEDINQRLKPQ
jgi:hypothetical protein